MTIWNKLITKLDNTATSLLNKYIVKTIKRTGDELCATFGHKISFEVSFDLVSQLGTFSPTYKNGELVDSKITIYVNSILKSAEKHFNDGATNIQTFRFIKKQIIATCAHEYGHLLQVYKIDNFYTRYVQWTCGKRLLNDSSILKHRTVKTLVLDEKFRQAIYKMAKSLIVVERDANLFAKEVLTNKGYTVFPNSIVTEFNDFDTRWDFTIAYVIPRTKHFLKLFSTKVYKDNTSTVEVEEIAEILSFVCCNLIKETALMDKLTPNAA